MANSLIEKKFNLITEVLENVQTNSNGIAYLPIGAPHKLVTVYANTYALMYGYSTIQDKYFVVPLSWSADGVVAVQPNITIGRIIYRYYD